MKLGRCPHCDAPGRVRNGRVRLDHLSWCPLAPKPPEDRQTLAVPSPTETEGTEQ